MFNFLFLNFSLNLLGLVEGPRRSVCKLSPEGWREEGKL